MRCDARELALRYLYSALIAGCLIAVSALSGCGGSSDGNSDGGGPPPVVPPPVVPPPPPLPSLSIDATNAQSIAQASITSFEFALMIADEASFVLQKLDDTSLYTHPWNCSNGTATYSLIDADQDGKVSVGDSAIAAYSDCETVTTDGTISGQLSIDVSDIDNFRGKDDVRYSGTASTGALAVTRTDGQVTLNGDVDFGYNRGVYESSLSASGSFAFRPPASEIMTHVWDNLNISKTENYETATYTIDVSGQMRFDNFEGTATVTATQQFVGHLNTFPDSGMLEFTSSNTSQMRVARSAVQLDAAQISVDESGDGSFTSLAADVLWNDLSKGYLWWYELGSPSRYNIKTFDVDDFSILNRRPYFRGNLGSEAATVAPEIRIQTSRAVDPATVTSNVQMKHGLTEWPYTPILVDLDVEVQGAMIFFRPTTQLAPGSPYSFPTVPFQFRDFNGNLSGFTEFDGSIRVSEPINAVADPEEEYGFPGRQLVLDASQSTSESNQNMSYSWEQILGSAVAITGANKQQATVTLPPVTTPELVRIYLKSTNEYGEFDYAKTDISVYPDPFMIDIVVTRGTGIDGSRNETLYTPVNGTQTYFYNGQDVLKVENDTDYVVAENGSASVAFRRDLDITFGLPSGVPLAAGVYDVPVDSGLSTPRLRIGGNEGCFGGPGRFEIIEIQIGLTNEVERVAADYWFQCGPGYENTEVTGHVRFNSFTPIPAAR